MLPMTRFVLLEVNSCQLLRQATSASKSFFQGLCSHIVRFARSSKRGFSMPALCLFITTVALRAFSGDLGFN